MEAKKPAMGKTSGGLSPQSRGAITRELRAVLSYCADTHGATPADVLAILRRELGERDNSRAAPAQLARLVERAEHAVTEVRATQFIGLGSPASRAMASLQRAVCDIKQCKGDAIKC